MMTYRCSAACRHCLMMSSPGQDAFQVALGDAVEYGRDFQSLGRQVIIAGGEALLFFEHVLAMCRALQAAGVPVAFIESNGSWCSSDRLTSERLRMLHEAGVQWMYFSIDGYHQEFVPAERVHRVVRIAHEIFGSEQVIAPTYSLKEARSLETLTSDPERLRQTARAAHIHWIGRAALELAGFREEVSGWPKLIGAPARKDTDQDGMPDEWEIGMGLDPDDSDDRNGDNDGDGYTNLEEYLNSLVTP
jgi:hypothetical protein